MNPYHPIGIVVVSDPQQHNTNQNTEFVRAKLKCLFADDVTFSLFVIVRYLTQTYTQK